MWRAVSMFGGGRRAAFLFLLGAALLVALAPRPGRAEGALAIGEPADIGEDGVSFGYSYGFTTSDEAQQRALAECRGPTGASDEVKALCKIVATFRDQCVSVAFDPAEGEAGFGWALAPDQAAADEAALAKCRATSKPERQSYCSVQGKACDRS